MHKTKQDIVPLETTFSLFEGLPPIFPSCYPLFGRIEYYHGYWTG